MTFIISITGSVAAGKSTIARTIRDILLNSPNQPFVDLISTDGFLYSTQELTSRGLMNKKGFPESYDQVKFIQFLKDIKSGVPELSIPIYSHETYDLTDKMQVIQSPDILIIEGVNAEILTDHNLIDLSIYIDAPVELIEQWYLDRVKKFVKAAADNPNSFYYSYVSMPEDELINLAKDVWKTINELNLNEHILPYKPRADLVIEKGASHCITRIID
jgi:type I pantothenate kinase